MSKTDRLRKAIKHVQETKGMTTIEAKKHLCRLLTTPFRIVTMDTMDSWLTRSKPEIPDHSIMLIECMLELKEHRQP